MAIIHIFKINDHYTNIDRLSIIGDNYLLNVYTDCYYSNSLISRVCWTKVKILIKLHHIRTQTTIFPFANINLEQNKTSVSICVTPDIK